MELEADYPTPPLPRSKLLDATPNRGGGEGGGTPATVVLAFCTGCANGGVVEATIL
jgi:hypothetical protein